MIENGNNKMFRTGGEQGYVLLVFILFSALLMVSLSLIIPKAVFEGQRDKEDELIFRGLQYQHAIQLFVRKLGRYPNSVDELVKTNNIRFLRKRYKDPMTKGGEWRAIHLGPNGVFVDALTSLAPPTASITPVAGAAPAGGIAPASGTGPQPSTSAASTDPATGTSANPGANPLQPRTNTPGQQSPDATSPTGSQGTTPGTSGTPQPTPFAQLASGGPTFGGGPIAGFASRSKDESIKVWKGYDEYDKWEFIYDYRQDPVAAAAIARGSGQQQPSQPGGAPTQPGAPSQPGGPGFPGGTTPPPSFQQPGSINNPGGAPGFPNSPIPGGFPPPRQQ